MQDDLAGLVAGYKDALLGSDFDEYGFTIKRGNLRLIVTTIEAQAREITALRGEVEESVAEQTAIKRVKNALISDMIAEIETLRADNERLRAALKVIAESTPHYLDAWMRASARTALAECKALGDA